jgi:hypothetical protein
MGTFSIFSAGNQLIIDYSPSEGDENGINVMTFFSPSLEVKGNLFKFFENGVYKKALNFNQIANIGDAPADDVMDAVEKIVALISSFNTPIEI